MGLAKELKRVAGMLLARIPDLKLEEVDDPRQRRGRRWRLDVILKTVLVGIAAGCQSVAEIEALTERMSGSMRRKLGIARRIPDTTMRLVLLRLSVYDLRRAMRHLLQAAQKRKALGLDDKLPFHVVSMDGKTTSISHWDHHYAQQQTSNEGLKARGLVRTISSCLISTAAKPILDAFPVPAETNEMGVFGHAFESLLRGYGNLFQLVTYDAGVPSEDNCQLVVDAGKDFCFRIKNESWLIYKDAQRLLGQKSIDAALAQQEHVVAKNESVFRRVFLAKAPNCSWVWDSIKSLVRINVRTIKDGQLVHEEDKFYISSLAQDGLTPEQWLIVTRGHWAVENNVHWTLDAIFKEDAKPFFPSEPRGTAVVMMLRRIVYNLLALFRAVTLRSETKRTMPWKALLAWVLDCVIAITQAQLDTLRPRLEPTAAS